MEKRFAVEFEYTKERYKDCYKYIFWGSSFAFWGYALAVICVLGIILSVAVKEYLSISFCMVLGYCRRGTDRHLFQSDKYYL